MSSRLIEALARIELALLRPNLAGKDYFTQDEAARYCCVSLRRFEEVATGHAIRPVKFGGKLVYRRTDCARAIEREFDRSHHCAGPQLRAERPPLTKTDGHFVIRTEGYLRLYFGNGSPKYWITLRVLPLKHSSDSPPLSEYADV